MLSSPRPMPSLRRDDRSLSTSLSSGSPACRLSCCGYGCRHETRFEQEEQEWLARARGLNRKSGSSTGPLLDVKTPVSSTRGLARDEEAPWCAMQSRAASASSVFCVLVPQGGFEPSTYALRMRCSTG